MAAYYHHNLNLTLVSFRNGKQKASFNCLDKLSSYTKQKIAFKLGIQMRVHLLVKMHLHWVWWASFGVQYFVPFLPQPLLHLSNKIQLHTPYIKLSWNWIKWTPILYPKNDLGLSFIRIIEAGAHNLGELRVFIVIIFLALSTTKPASSPRHIDGFFIISATKSVCFVLGVGSLGPQPRIKAGMMRRFGASEGEDFVWRKSGETGLEDKHEGYVEIECVWGVVETSLAEELQDYQSAIEGVKKICRLNHLFLWISFTCFIKIFKLTRVLRYLKFCIHFIR